MTGAPADTYYAATANRATAHAALAGERRADVCVVGGGFTGLAAALAAAEAGYAVVLLEADRIGAGASGRNGGHLIPGLRWSMREISDAFGQERAQAIHDLALSAVDRVHDRVAAHAIACDLKPGHLEAAWKPAHFDTMRREADFLAERFGRTDLDVVAAADMRGHVGTDSYHGGIYDRRGGHFHPLNYALGLAAAAVAAGVTIFEQSRVVTIADGPTADVGTATGSVTANHVVIATDAWTRDIAPELGGYTVLIMNYNIATAPLDETVARALLPSDAAVADSRFVLNYFRLSADRRMIFGGGEKYSQRPPRDIAAFVRPHMTRLFPMLAATPVDYRWGGAVSVTMNRLPHIGRRGNIWFAHGFSGHGALITTLAGELVIEAMRGTTERFDVLAGFPHRTFPGGKRLRKPLATLGLLWYALRDRL